MKILACYNIKGGVGKTTTTVNLAHLCALEGARVLVWDLDPQGAASFYFRIKPKVKGGMKRLLSGRSSVSQHIKGTDYHNIDLIPADFSYRHLDVMLESMKKSKVRLKKLLKPLVDEYDYVFLDCPPSFSMVSENVFYASDALIIPTIPTILSLRTLEQIIRYRDKKALKGTQLIPFFSMVDRRKTMHRMIVEMPPKLGVQFAEADIPYASDVERMGFERKPLILFKPNIRAAESYRNLWQTIKARLSGA
ncbi:MAG TPA: cobyrinic acid a,c-diamide synthase [Gammaproteobacteria bacterium]|nr:cobyrinic acid a,c-diamide synthase [Gammaproteobacteria bacterium]